MDRPVEDPEDELVFFQKCGSNVEASLLQGLLEENDIYSFIQGEHHRALLGPFGRYIALNLLVPRSELERAAAVVREARASAASEEN
jgi:hypothetical protein